MVDPPPPPADNFVFTFRPDVEDQASAQALGWGTTVPEAEVTLTPKDPLVGGPQTHSTTAAGTVTIARLTAGDYVVEAKRWLSAAERDRLTAGDDWAGTATLGIAQESRDRRDVGGNSPIGTSVSSFSPSMALELGRSVGERFFVAAGAAFSFYGPTSALPDPNNRGPLYQTYSASELDLSSSRATPVAFSLMLKYRTGNTATLWLSGRTERLSSSESVPISSFSPSGSRTATSFSGGVILR